MSLSDLSNVNYNGFQFPLESNTTVISTPKRDAAERTVMYVEHVICIKFRLIATTAASGNTNDQAMEDIRQILLAQGAALTFEDKGFGSLSVNQNAGGPRDVVWGPIPLLLRWEPIGGQAAADVEWQCRVAVPECDTASYTNSNYVFNYQILFEIDRQGYTTRTVTGFAMRSMTRFSADDRTLPDDADNIRESIQLSVPSGFRRIRQQFPINYAKNRIEFTIQDEEIPRNGALQLSVVDCHATFTARSSRFYSCQVYNTLEATYTLTRETPRSQSFFLFMDLIQSKYDQIRQSGAGPQIPIAYSVREDIFGREAGSFSFTWINQLTQGKPQDLNKIGISGNRFNVGGVLSLFAGRSGLWAPVIGTDYASWQASIATAQSVRGDAGLRSLASDDLIIDACATNSGVLRTNGGADITLPATIYPGAPSLAVALSPENSFLHVENKVRMSTDSGMIRQKPLPLAPNASFLTALTAGGAAMEGILGATSITADDTAGGEAAGSIDSNVGNNLQNTAVLVASSDALPDIFQVRVQPSTVINAVGYAVRVGYPLSPPVIASVNGVVAVPDGGDFTSDVVSVFGVPFFRASWSLLYSLPTVPTGNIGALATVFPF